MGTSKTRQSGFFVVGAGVTLAVMGVLAGSTAYVVNQEKSEEQIAIEHSVELVDNRSTGQADEN